MPRLQHNPIPQFSDRDKFRFEVNVDQRGPDECWPWTAGRCKAGYGRFKTKLRWRNLVAHRVAFFLATGIDPLEKCVCHSCDNPPCCNPNHLFLGTQAENIRQMWKRHRSYSRVGENNPRAKLTMAEIDAIRSAYEAGSSLRQLSAGHGISKTQTSRIVNQESWATGLKRLHHPIRKNPGKPGQLNAAAKLTPAEVNAIRSRYKEGQVTQKQLGREYGVSQCHVQRIVTGKNWVHTPTEIG